MKGGAFENVKNFAIETRTQYDLTIKKFILDRGMEFGGSKLSNLMTEMGTRLEITTLYLSYQNRGSERSNCVILDKLRTVMADQVIPEFLWPELIRAVAHITNRTANCVFQKTPFKMFMDHIHPMDDNKPSIAHFRVLGCKAYIHIPKEKRAHAAKISLRAEVGILVGYEGTSIY